MTAVTVIVPTCNRADEVTRLLRALERQEPIDGGFEAIVVADGCTDSTARRLRSSTWSFPLQILEQAASGAATARNCGAALASGRILLFLDDDVEPEPSLLRAHVALHESRTGAIGIGYLPPVVAERGLLGIALRGWWESMFDGMRRPDHRYSYKDLLSGHFSIEASVFRQLGGFDASFRCHEDYEFGFRAIRSGLALQFLPDAVALHHDRSDLPKVLRRKFDEGVADVRLAQKHPELVPLLPFAWNPPEGRAARLLIRAAWDAPGAGDWVASRVCAALARYERWRLRYRWRARLEAILVYRYWRGVASAIGTREDLEALIATAPRAQEPETTVDLSAGLAQAERLLDEIRPRSVRLVLGPHLVGTVADLPGGEALRGAHLRRLIARDFANAYARAAAACGYVPPAVADAIPTGMPPFYRSRQACAA